MICTGFENRFPAGMFTCLYEGEGDLEFTGDLNEASNSDEEGAASMESDTVSDEDLDRLGYSNAHTSGQP